MVTSDSLNGRHGQRPAVVHQRGTWGWRFAIYAAVQTYSALVLLLALAFPRRYTHSSALAVVVGLYALAKALESLDKPIFAADTW